jgi:hypothetical protein
MHYHAIKAIQFKTSYHVTHDISDHDSSLEEKWHVPSFSNNDGLILGFLGFPYNFCITSQNYNLLKSSMYLNIHPHIRKTLCGYIK